MPTANINTTILTWARERSGDSLSQLAAKLDVSVERLLQWESGEHTITFKQAMNFAKRTHIPFGYLFLSSPPNEALLIPDLRTVKNATVSQPSSELLDLVKLMQQRQEWYRDYLQQQLIGPNPFVGRFSVGSNPSEIVINIRQALQVETHPQRGNSDDYYSDLISRIESLRILVMRQANIGNYTRPLRVEEFRGFAIMDDYAPLIFINHADAPGARMFTLIHELCHLWIGQSGIFDGDNRTSVKAEILCNAVAAEFLVPEEEFRQRWQINLDNWQDNLTSLEHYFRVSKYVLARRAMTLKLIGYEDYANYIAVLQAEWKQREKKSGGPNYYRTKKAQIGLPFARAVVEQALSGRLLLREEVHCLMEYSQVKSLLSLRKLEHDIFAGCKYLYSSKKSILRYGHMPSLLGLVRSLVRFGYSL